MEEKQIQSGEAQAPATQPMPIAELIDRPGYPESLRGELVDIGGFIGQIMEVVHNSIKVRSPDNMTRSFNFHTLKRLYGPREEILRQPETANEEAQPEPKTKTPVDLDFDQPVQPISAFFDHRDYPECTLGKHVDIAGYQGIVAEIINGSLKVRSRDEITRSYNAAVLRKVQSAKRAG